MARSLDNLLPLLAELNRHRDASELAAGPAAVAIHTGPYEKLGDAHKAIESWIADGGHEKGGDAYELYLTDPGEVPDPADWKTKIVWPLAQ